MYEFDRFFFVFRFWSLHLFFLVFLSSYFLLFTFLILSCLLLLSATRNIACENVRLLQVLLRRVVAFTLLSHHLFLVFV